MYAQAGRSPARLTPYLVHRSGQFRACVVCAGDMKQARGISWGFKAPHQHEHCSALLNKYQVRGDWVLGNCRETVREAGLALQCFLTSPQPNLASMSKTQTITLTPLSPPLPAL
jgi:hypothetical protein